MAIVTAQGRPQAVTAVSAVSSLGSSQLTCVITGSARPREGGELKEVHVRSYGQGAQVDVYDTSRDQWVPGVVEQCLAQRSATGQLMGATVCVKSPLGVEDYPLSNPGLNPHLRVHQSGHVSAPACQGEKVRIFSATRGGWQPGRVAAVDQKGAAKVAFTNKTTGEHCEKIVPVTDSTQLRASLTGLEAPALVRSITPYAVWSEPIIQDDAQRFPPKIDPFDATPAQTVPEGELTPEVAQQVARRLHQSVEDAKRLQIIPEGNLGNMKVSELTKMAMSLDVDADDLDAALDADDKESAIIELIKAKKKPAFDERAARDALAVMKVSQLKKLARQLGVSEDDSDEALDSDSPAESFIKVILPLQKAEAEASA